MINYIFFDVQIAHPAFDSEDWTAEKAAKRQAQKDQPKETSTVTNAWKRKKAKYMAQYDIDGSTVQPMVFSTYGEYASQTMAYLFNMVQTIAQGLGDVIVSNLWNDLRYRIASTLARAQARVLDYFSWRTRTPTGGRLLSTPRSRSLESPNASQEFCSEEDIDT